jgi:hypothetical protein
LEKHGERAKHGQVILAREPSELDSVPLDTRAVAAHQFEHRRVVSPECERAHMCDAREPFVSTLDMGDRAIDVAERP